MTILVCSPNRSSRLSSPSLSDQWASITAGARAFIAAFVLLLGAGLPMQAAQAEELPTLPLTVNVNTADARTIANVLQGVGLSRATAIVDYRQQHGAFTTVESLRDVKGVGQRTLELNATRILLKD